jgi:hypothetical protein
MDDTLGRNDFYYDERGLMVLTESYLRRRGYCCDNGCRHCPYKPVARPGCATDPNLRRDA